MLVLNCIPIKSLENWSFSWSAFHTINNVPFTFPVISVFRNVTSVDGIIVWSEVLMQLGCLFCLKKHWSRCHQTLQYEDMVYLLLISFHDISKYSSKPDDFNLDSQKSSCPWSNYICIFATLWAQSLKYKLLKNDKTSKKKKKSFVCYCDLVEYQNITW